MRTILPLLILVLLLSLNIHAEDIIQPEDKDWQAFIDDAHDTYSQKRRGDEAMRILALRVDEVLTETKKSLDKLATDLLNRNQQAWEKQIRTKCSFMADTYRGGSAADIAFRYCIVNEQKLRINELRSMHQYRMLP